MSRPLFPEGKLNPQATFPTVESFSLFLNGLDQVLHAPSPTRWLEAQLLSRLDRPIRLLRWAIVSVELSPKEGIPARRFRCEGSYLRRPGVVANAENN